MKQLSRKDKISQESTFVEGVWKIGEKMQQVSTRVTNPGNLQFHLNSLCILSNVECIRAAIGFHKGDTECLVT